jgi:hypothetical protein
MDQHFGSLPNELAIEILSNLTVYEMVRTMRVSKHWRILLFSIKEFWLDFAVEPIEIYILETLDTYFTFVEPPLCVAVVS